MRYALALCFVLSGAAGLIIELQQARLLGVWLGATAWAHVVVLCAFFGGSAIGAACLGRVADRNPHRAVLLYAALEAFIAACALLGPEWTALVGRLWSALSANAAPDALLLPARLAVASLAMLPPAIAMGGTLPVLARWIRDTRRDLGPDLAVFYAMNSAGAAGGVLLAAFVLTPALGVAGALRAAAVGSIAATVLALAARALDTWVQRRALLSHAVDASTDPMPDPRTAGPKPPDAEPDGARGPLLAALVGGAGALGLEVAWTRLFAMVFGSSHQAFALMLAAFVAGIAGGGLAASALLAQGADPRRVAMRAWLVATALLALQHAFGEHLPWMQFELAQALERRPDVYPWMLAAQAALAFGWMLPVTFAAGLALPCLAALHARSHGRAAAQVGIVFAANTAGTVLAPPIALFVLMPALGLQGAIAFCGALLALAALLVAPARARRHVAVIAIALTLAPALVPRWNASVMHAGGFRRWTIDAESTVGEFREFRRRSEVVLTHDGPVDSVVVLRNPAGDLFLKVNGKTDASDTPDLATQRLLGHIPLVLRRAGESTDPLDVLVVGVGSGVTAGTAALHPGTRVTALELSDGVLQAVPFFAHVNHGLLDRTNAHVVRADAREWIERTNQLFDVVISQPSNPWVAGNAALFTREFFALVAAHLDQGGIFAQWMHTYAMDDESLAIVVRTLRAVFPHVEVWQVWTADLLLVASLDPIVATPDRIASAMQSPAVAADLRNDTDPAADISSLHRFLALQIASAARVDEVWQADGPEHSDRHPILEQRAPVAQFTGSEARIPVGLDERLDVARPPAVRAADVPCTDADRTDLLAFFAARETDADVRIAGSLQHAVASDGRLANMPDVATRATGLPALLEAWTFALLDAERVTQADCDAWAAAALQALPTRASLWARPDVRDARAAFVRCADLRPDARLPMRALEAELLVRTGWRDEARALIDTLLSEPLPPRAAELLRALRPPDERAITVPARP